MASVSSLAWQPAVRGEIGDGWVLILGMAALVVVMLWIALTV